MDLKERIARLFALHKHGGEEKDLYPHWIVRGRAEAEDVLSLVREEIPKHQLTDEEIRELTRCVPCELNKECPSEVISCEECQIKHGADNQFHSILKALGGE